MNNNNEKNKKWDLRFLEIAKCVSKWSKDPSSKIGAVIVGAEKQIISQGYNGFPRKIEDKESRYQDRETKHKFIIHAEVNAILNASRNGTSVLESTIYVHGLPVCHICAGLIIQSGIKRVVMDTGLENTKWKESGKLALEMFDEAKIEYVFYL